MTSEDLLEHFKLEAEVFPTHTIQYSYRLNRVRGVREQLQTRWQRMDRVGKGAFGEVWQEVSTRTNGSEQVRAVKVLDKEEMKRRKIDFKKEVLALAVLSKEKHQQMQVLVSLLNWYENAQNVFIAMEYFEKGDLSHHIDDISNESEVRQITINLLEGLNILHTEGFAHRDLKPQNIFVFERPPSSERWCVKIGDFGISKRVRAEETAWRTETGTPHFMAPEIQGFIHSCEETSIYTNAVDAWSLGCVVYYCSTRVVPFTTSRDCNRYCCGLLQLPHNLLSHRLGDAGIGFVQGLLTPEPTHRTTIIDGLRHPWIVSLPLSTEPHIPVQIATEEHFEAPTNVSYRARTLTRQAAYNRHQPSVSDRKGTGTQHRPSSISETSSSNSLWDPSIHDDYTKKQKEKQNARHPANETPTKDIHLDPGSKSTVQANRTSTYALSSPTVKQEDAPVMLRLTSNKVDFTHERGETTSSHMRFTSNDRKDENPTTVRPVFDESAGNVGVASARKDSSVPSTAASSKEAEFEDIIDWNRSVKICKYSGAIQTVSFSSGGVLLALKFHNGSVLILETTTWRYHSMLFQEFRGQINSFSFLPNGNLLAVALSGDEILYWDIKMLDLFDILYASSQEPTTRDAFSTGQFPALQVSDSTKNLVDSKRKHGGYLSRDHGQVISVVLSPDGRSLALCFDDGTIEISDIITHKSVCIYKGYSTRVSKVAFSPDAKLLASKPSDGNILLWDTTTGKQVGTKIHVLGLDILFSPDGKLLASVSTTAIHLWDLSARECRVILPLRLSVGRSWIFPAGCIAFSPDGKLVASGSGHRDIQIWDTMTGIRRSLLEGHDRSLTSIAFSSNGRFLASGSEDGTLRLWGDVPEQAATKHANPSLIGSTKNLFK